MQAAEVWNGEGHSTLSLWEWGDRVSALFPYPLPIIGELYSWGSLTLL